ncbi:MAG: transcriptional regulator [Bacteroidetes bacterium]|nr:transcriptional regulator [Bacteroidota bacterium]
MIEGLNKQFENRVRLGIMALLMVRDKVEFLTFKEELEISDGNLASHMSALEKNEYVRVLKDFVGKKTRTRYEATQVGRLEFEKHIRALETMIQGMK